MNKRGSYTIEAALLMPLITAVVVLILYMAYFTHDRATLQKSAYIAALRGSQIRTGDQDTYTEAERNAGELYRKRLLGSWSLQHTVLVNTDTVTVTYTGSMKIPGGVLVQLILPQDLWETTKTAAAYRVDEPEYIRRVRAHQSR